MGVFVVTPAHEPLFSPAPSAAQIQLQQNLWLGRNHNPNPNPNLNLVGSAGAGGGGATCQDCGNQAKKDCSHGRCRTCCKSRGFECTTHVRSTWVPAARRRERQVSPGGGAAAGVDGSGSASASTSGTKKPRLLTAAATNSHTSTSNTTRSFDTSSSHQDARFRERLPGHVKASAVFKCVRVTSIDDDGEDEFAYQAMVKIGGHVFKGFLYDQGVDDGRSGSEHLAVAAGGESSNAQMPSISELHLGGGASAAGGALAGLLGGTSYGNPIN